jgi:hypothetical protein
MSDSKQKRFQGEVDKWCEQFGFISYSNSGAPKRIYFSLRNVKSDWKGSRAWVCGQGIPVTFTITQRRDSKSGLMCDCAEGVQPVFPMSEPQDLSQYRETSVIYKKDFAFVFLRRECGDATFLHKNDVVDQYQSRWGLLVEGAPVYHGMRFSEEKQQWQACDAELYSQEELDEFFNPSPVEPDAIPEAESEPELKTVLAPSTRSLPLVEIIRQRKS